MSADIHKLPERLIWSNELDMIRDRLAYFYRKFPHDPGEHLEKALEHLGKAIDLYKENPEE